MIIFNTTNINIINLILTTINIIILTIKVVIIFEIVKCKKEGPLSWGLYGEV